MRELNGLYRREPALYEVDDDYQRLRVDRFPRRGRKRDLVRPLRAATAKISSCSASTSRPCRATATASACRSRAYREILNTDAEMFGGSNMGNGGWAGTAGRFLSRPCRESARDAAAAGGGGV